MLTTSFDRYQSTIWEVKAMLDMIGNNNSTKVLDTNGTIGGDMRSPVPSSLQRHIFLINGAKDFLNKEKAIKGSIISTN